MKYFIGFIVLLSSVYVNAEICDGKRFKVGDRVSWLGSATRTQTGVVQQVFDNCTVSTTSSYYSGLQNVSFEGLAKEIEPMLCNINSEPTLISSVNFSNYGSTLEVIMDKCIDAGFPRENCVVTKNTSSLPAFGPQVPKLDIVVTGYKYSDGLTLGQSRCEKLRTCEDKYLNNDMATVNDLEKIRYLMSQYCQD